MQSEKIIERIVSWLKDYAEKAGVKGYVIGVSGGVDSGVVSTLCAMTGLKVLAIEMPIRQQKDQASRALEHIDFLKNKFPNVEGFTVDLNEPFEALYKTFDVKDDEFPAEKLAFANTRSRLRMLTLYYYGQINGLLVCGTGNKVEDFGIGFYTKYGDGGVDLLPIANLLKGEVYEWAKVLGVPNEIINKAPSAGLWEGQTDELEMGTTYDYIDAYISGNEIPEKDRVIIDKLHISSEHKRSAIPTPPIF